MRIGHFELSQCHLQEVLFPPKKEAVTNAKKAIKAYMEAIEKSEIKKELTKEVVNIPISFATA